MAPTGDSSPGELSKESETISTSFKNCGHCKRPVKEKIECKKCKQNFHPSCLITANKSKNNQCVHEADDKSDVIEKLLLEVKLLNKIISEKDEKYNLLKQNCKLLEENNRLLKENNKLLSEKDISQQEIKEQKAGEDMGTKPKKLITAQREKNINMKLPTTKEAQGEGPSNHTTYREYRVPRESVQNNESNEHNEKTENEEWHVQKQRIQYRGKTRKPMFYGTSEEDEVKGVPRKSWYFLSRLNPELTEEDVKTALLKKCPQKMDIIVEKQKLFHNAYQSAFKVGIPTDFEEYSKNSAFWPKDSKVDKFNFFLFRRKLQRID